MADHPETFSLRLAEAATEACGGTARWSRGKERADGTAQVYAPSYGPLRRVVPVAETTAVFGAHAHPGRVRAWLGAVARLRERAAEGHALECETRMPTMVALARGEPGECDCGHDLDAARAWMRATGEGHKTDGLPDEGRALISASRTVKSEEDVASALCSIGWWDQAQVAEALSEIDSEVSP